jgi:hypothetical protein
MFPHKRILSCSLASPWTRLSRPRSTIKGSDFPRGVCLPLDGPFSRHTRLLWSRPRGISQVPQRFLFCACRALRPRRTSSGLAGSGHLPLAFHVFERVGVRSFVHEAHVASLALRPTYRPVYASPMSLPPCAQDSVPGEVAPLLPGRELHPLKAPGLPWRTKVASYVAFNHPLVTFSAIASEAVPNEGNSVIGASSWPEAI